jgi:hypothetical protein
VTRSFRRGFTTCGRRRPRQSTFLRDGNHNTKYFAISLQPRIILKLCLTRDLSSSVRSRNRYKCQTNASKHERLNHTQTRNLAETVQKDVTVAPCMVRSSYSQNTRACGDSGQLATFLHKWRDKQERQERSIRSACGKNPRQAFVAETEWGRFCDAPRQSKSRLLDISVSNRRQDGGMASHDTRIKYRVRITSQLWTKPPHVTQLSQQSC